MKTHSDKKGAIELSMTTIIVVVIGITMLTLGLAWIKDTFSNIDELGQGAFDSADALLQDTMASNKPFHISGISFDATPGGDGDIIGIGIRNNIGGTTVQLTVEDVGAEIYDSSWILVPEAAIPATEGELTALPIKIKIPKTIITGSTCFYLITAKDENENLYGSDTIIVNIV